MKLLLLAVTLINLGFFASAAPGQSIHYSKRDLDVESARSNWDTAYAKAKASLAHYNLTEKVTLGTGAGWQVGPCVGNTPAIPSQNFPGLCLQDSPLGVRLATEVSAFPAAINAAATFNRDLIQKRGEAMGAEHRGKGVNVALGPMMNMMRAPEGGRAWEGFGADPFLAGEGAVATIKGIQSQGVQATAKHYIFNEQEHYRQQGSSNVDDRTTHEFYGQPFYKSVLAGVASVMCSYNRIDDIYACSNSRTMTEILKGEFGFKGYIQSDWWATHNTSDAAAGLDMTMPGNKVFGFAQDSYFGAELVAAVQNGTIPESRIDDLALRILSAWYLVGQDKNYPAPNLYSWNFTDPRNQHVDVQGDHATLIRQIDAASVVLLKNNNATLPLYKPRTIAIIGSDAATNPAGPDACADRGCNNGTLAMGWGSGTAEFPYLIDPITAITKRAGQDQTTVSSSLSDSDLAAAATTAAGKDVAFVFINSDSGEDYITVEGNEGDKNDLNAWHGGDALVQAVAAVNPNTIVVVHSTGPILVEAWVNHPNVTALVWAGIPGQESGNGLVDVLYGDVNPSGRIPYTIAKQRSDYPADVLYSSPDPIPEINYTEGLLVDYRWFDAKNIAPRYEFGFGLSYTSFSYDKLNAWATDSKGGPKSSTDPSLHENIATITFKLTNGGHVDGTEIPQLYVSFPASSNSPPQVLKGFDSIYLNKGESTTVQFCLTRYDLSVWDSDTKQWTIPDGDFGLSVGASSRDKRLSGTLTLN